MFLSDFFLELFNRAMAAGWLVLVILALRLVLKKAPRWVHCLLWGLVGLRLVWPFSWESVVSLLPSREVLPPAALFDPTPEIHTGIAVLNTAVNQSFTPAMAPAELTSVNPLQIWTWLAGWVWAIGAAGLLLYALISWLRLRRRVAVFVEEDGLRRCDNIDSPFILGVFRPGIYVPSDLTGETLAHVAAHERAHLKRRDHWWKPLSYLLLTVFWFHPLLWVGYILLCRDIELACDERVIRTMDDSQKKAYSLALVDCAAAHRTIAACPVAFGELGVKQRVKSVLHYKKPAFWVVLAAVLLCIVLAVCFLTDPVSGDGQLPLDTVYHFREVIYSNGSYSSSYDLFVADRYAVSADGHFLKDGEDLGPWQPITLTKENFDGLLQMPLVWTEGYDAAKLRRDNADAWTLTKGEGLFFLLRQKDGAIYLAQGHDSAEHDPVLRFIFRLGETPGTLQKPDGQDIPVTAEVPDPLADGSAYITTDCVFLNPLSSYFRGDGDSGFFYYIDSRDFVAVHRNSMTSQRLEGMEAQWRDLPFTDEEWNAKFWMDPVDLSGYTERLYRHLEGWYYLLSLDGALWLVEDHMDEVGIWSIYALKPVDSIAEAQWSYMDGVDAAHRPMVLEFDLEFDRLHLDCDQGQIYGATTNVNYKEKLYYPGQNEVIYWTPLNLDGSTAPDHAAITFSLWKNDAVTAEGVLTIDRQGNCGIQVSGAPVGTVSVKDFDMELLFLAELPADGPAPEPTIADRILSLDPAEIGYVTWDGWVEPPTIEDALTMLRRACENQVETEPFQEIWHMRVFLGDRAQTTWNYDDAIRISVGLEEPLLHISGGQNVPGAHIVAADEELYWMIRTYRDAPPLGIDQTVYDLYRDTLEAYLADVPQLPASAAGTAVDIELTGLQLADSSEKLHAQAYTVEVVWNVEPREQALNLIAGGAYVDSQLRCHGMNASSQYLIVVDGQPAGFVGWWFLSENNRLDRFETKEALLTAIQNDG